MEYINEIAPFVPDLITPEEQIAEKHFITANTIAGNLAEMKDHHLIPVFNKDNEPTISHTDFIETVSRPRKTLHC